MGAMGGSWYVSGTIGVEWPDRHSDVGSGGGRVRTWQRPPMNVGEGLVGELAPAVTHDEDVVRTREERMDELVVLGEGDGADETPPALGRCPPRSGGRGRRVLAGSPTEDKLLRVLAVEAELGLQHHAQVPKGRVRLNLNGADEGRDGGRVPVHPELLVEQPHLLRRSHVLLGVHPSKLGVEALLL